MKTAHFTVEPQESGSQHWQGSSIQVRLIRLCVPAGSTLRTAVASGLFACLALSGLAQAQASTPDLVRQAQQQLLLGEISAAKALLQQVPPSDRKAPPVIFEQALLDDAQGRHAQARQGYDHLQDGPLAKAVAVPSAVNLVAVGQFRQARQAFKQLGSGQDPYVAGYAQLWQLWLMARTGKGGSAIQQVKLAEAASRLHAASPQQQAIGRLYAGEGSVEAVFAAIDSMNLADPLQRRDARSEAAFFAGGYLQYVRRDYPAALRLYRQELSQPGASIERPLLEKALAALPVATR
jgi:tetratricopeptide (TPR) repeat protein